MKDRLKRWFKDIRLLRQVYFVLGLARGRSFGVHPKSASYELNYSHLKSVAWAVRAVVKQDMTTLISSNKSPTYDSDMSPTCTTSAAFDSPSKT